MLLAGIRVEWRKTFSTRLWWILGLVLVGYIGFMALVMAASLNTAVGSDGSYLSSRDVAQMVYSLAPAMGYVVPALIGAMAVTTEFRYQTITSTLLADPNRSRVLSAKAFGAVPIGAVFGLLGVVTCLGIGGAVLALGGHPTELGTGWVWRNAALTVLAMGIWCAVGVGFGSLLKNQVAAIVVLLAFTQLVEPVLRIALISWPAGRDVAQFLPGSAGDALVGGTIYTNSNFLDQVIPTLTEWQGGLVLAGYAAVLCIIGRWITWKRDV